MKLLLEQEVYSEAHAKELLNIQANYNKSLQELNNKLAQQKSACDVKYMKIAQQQAAAGQAAATTGTSTVKNVSQGTQQTAKQTGTVTTAGQPVSANGNPAAATVESYPDILRIKELNEDDDEIRYTGNMNPRPASNWYERPVTGGHPEEKKREPRKKEMTWKIRQQMMDIESDIQQYEDEIRYIKEKFESPEGSVSGEVEEFFAQIGPEAADILNSGLSGEEKFYALKEKGIKNPEELIKEYYYYYPEFNPDLDDKRKEAEKEIPKIQKKIDKLQAKLDKMDTMYESLNENSFLIKNVDPYELQDLKDYLDAENISYSEDEDGETIDFDETELDQEWRDKMDQMGFEDNNPETETDDILSMDDDDDSEDFSNKDEKIDNEKVFYVKVDDEGEEFIGKIYKLFDDGDWRSKLVDGDSDTFEKLNYDPDWDEVDIIAFLRENYADAELMSEEEYNDHVENPEAEPEVEEAFGGNGNVLANDPWVKESMNETATSLKRIYDYFMNVNVETLDKSTVINQSFLTGYEGKPVSININAGTPAYTAWKAGRDRHNKENAGIKVSESTKLEPNLGGKIDMKTHKLLRKDQNKNDDELKDFEKEITEHKIPTLEEFMNENEMDEHEFSIDWDNTQKQNNFLDKLDEFGISYDDPGLAGNSVKIYPENNYQKVLITQLAEESDVDLNN